MPRETINMTPQEVQAFAASQRRVFLSTLDADGGPWAEAVPSTYRDGRIYFALSEGSRSLVSLRRDARACCILESSPAYYQIRAIIAHGVATEKPEDASGDAATGVWFSLPLDEIASFDFAKSSDATSELMSSEFIFVGISDPAPHDPSRSLPDALQRPQGCTWRFSRPTA